MSLKIFVNSKKKLEDLVYKPTRKLVKFTKSLGVPVIAFPRNIKNYKEYCNIVKHNENGRKHQKVSIPCGSGEHPILNHHAGAVKRPARQLDRAPHGSRPVAPGVDSGPIF